MISLIGLLEASVSGGICIILFFLVSQLCGERYPAKYKKVIWLLIALRLCIPVGFSLVPQPVTIQVPVYVLEGKEESQGVNNKSDLLADGAAIMKEGSEDETFTTKEGDLSGNTTTTVNPGGQLTSQSILIALWGFGCVAVMLHYLLSYFIFYRKMMKRSESCTNKNILVLTIKISHELGLKKIPEVRLTADEQEGPFTVGFFRNIIVLPNADYHEKDLKFIIRHELIHCASRDTQMKMLFMIVNAIHWFNPLAWLMRVLVDQDMELECDEKVLYAASKKDRSEYSEVLMSCISTSKVSRSTLSTGYVYNVKFIKKRFDYIFYSQKRIGKIVAAIIVVLLVVTSGLIGFEAGRTVYAESRKNVTTDISKYRQFDAFRGYSALSIFPEAIGEIEVIDYLYRYEDTFLDPTAEIYLECRYEEDTYQTEIERLQGIQAEYDGEVQTIIYDTENFSYPAYVTINANNHCYEYALLLGDGKIAYIFLQFIKEGEVYFPADYLPNAYETEDQGYSMYIFYKETLLGREGYGVF